MRTLLALLIAAAAGAAQAQATSAPDVRNFTAVGTVPEVCTIGQATANVGRLVNIRSLTGTLLQIDRLTDPTTLSTSPAAADVTFQAFCNYPHRLVVQSQNNGLWRESVGAGVATPQGFADAVPYTLGVVWGDISQTYQVDAAGRRMRDFQSNLGKPVSGDLLLHLEIQPGAANLRTQAPLLAGSYQDTILLTVEPQ